MLGLQDEHKVFVFKKTVFEKFNGFFFIWPVLDFSHSHTSNGGRINQIGFLDL